MFLFLLPHLLSVLFNSPGLSNIIRLFFLHLIAPFHLFTPPPSSKLHLYTVTRNHGGRRSRNEEESPPRRLRISSAGFGMLPSIFP